MVRGEEAFGEHAVPERTSRELGELISVCPECGGVLTEHGENGVMQWECHVGHRYSPRSLADAQAGRVEMALWTAVRMLRDRGALLERMARHADERGQPRSARHFAKQGRAANEQAEAVLEALRRAASTTLRSVVDGQDEPATPAEQAS
jgi:two-component system chemotaxis response regulator CheB